MSLWEGLKTLLVPDSPSYMLAILMYDTWLLKRTDRATSSWFWWLQMSCRRVGARSSNTTFTIDHRISPWHTYDITRQRYRFTVIKWTILEWGGEVGN